MHYILYGDKGSGSAAVELLLAELGLDVDTRAVPLDKDAQRADDFAALNPERKLPALVTPEGETLTESAAILLTLAERHAAAGLLPISMRERAQALRWLLFLASELYPIIEIHDYPARFQPEGEHTPPARRDELSGHARTIWQRRWLLFEQAAAGRPWFLPTGFSLLDIYCAVLSRWGQMDAWRTSHLPHVDGIARAIAARASLAAVWRRHFD